MSSTVLVTGATGFLATHIVDTLLASGYTVIGTARSEKKYAPILKEFLAKYPNAKFSYEIVADVGAAGAFDDLFKKHPEITKVMHTASPFSFGLEEKDLTKAYLDPAVNGTVNVLKAIKAYAPQVTNVVVTSSFASIVSFSEPSKTYTNADWNPVTKDQIDNEVVAYFASKTFAERAAWDFVETEKPNFKLATVCPPYIFGPQVFESAVEKTLNTSNEIITAALRLPKSNEFQAAQTGLAIDVRDVAKFHQFAIENKATEGQRLFISVSKFSFQSILNILNKDVPELKGKICVGDSSKDFPEVIVDFDIENVKKLVGGYEFISIEKSVVDTVEQYIKVNGSIQNI